MIDSENTDLKKSRRRRSAGVNGHIDRLPPQAIDAERGVIGCILIDANTWLNHFIIRFGDVGREVFYDIRHQEIWSVAVRMFEDRVPIDLITLQQRLKDVNLLEQVGGVLYLSACFDAVPSAANATTYADDVFEKWQLRRVIHTCTDTVGKIYEHEGELDALLDEIERAMFSLRDDQPTQQQPVKKLVQNTIHRIEDYHERQGKISGLSTGFPDFDKMTDGLHPGEMIVIAARPSLGKTSLAMNIVEHNVLVDKIPVGVFSLEMTAENLVERSLCSIARVNLRNLKEGFMSQNDFPKLTNASGKLSNSPLYIDDSSGLSIMQLRSLARRMWQQHAIKLLVIDYMQLLHSTTPRAAENRQIEIAEISSGIKALAKELKIPVIVLSQLNRELEKRTSRRPKLSDLRESGAIEQDADLVGLLYKPGVTNAENGDEPVEDADGQAVNLLIAKQRNGPTGDVHLTFLRSYTRFESAAKVSDEDVPSE